MEGISGMHSLTKELADIFAEESENDRTFHGFSENEIDDLCDHNASFENGLEDVPEPSLNETKTSSKRPGAQQFTLRVALRLRSHTPHSSEEDTEGRNNEENEYKEDMINKKQTTIRRTRHIKCEEEEKSVAPPPASLKSGSGSEDDATDCFLTKRDQNIKANKAMLSQLMADLQKIPEAAGFLKKHSTKKTKQRAYVKPTRNPERATRRQTRSMGGGEGSSGPQETELELSLEEELLEVRHAPQRRGTPRPNQTKPHVMRPVEEITEDELQLVADNMTEKVYNRVTGTTCHQCRQKTIDTKTCCRSEDCRGIQGQFCGPCLRNRYGEDVKKALLDPEWQCPPCRGICNCSFCRAREGRCPTGILFPLAQYHGFSDVHSYLSSLRNKLKNGEEDADL